LSSGHTELIEAPDGQEQTLIKLAANVDAIATCWANVTQQVIKAAPKCRIVARLGIGLDNIDIPTATQLRIPVTNVPDYCIPEVSEHTMGLLLAITRKISLFDREAKQGDYNLAAAGPMFRMEGRTLGLLGFGRIARAVRERALSFGLNEMVTLDELLRRSDYLSLHAPYNETSHHIINANTLAQMKPGAVLLNTARGGLIEHSSLWQAIQNGQIAGAGLDVFDPEPPDLNQPLYKDSRVIVTPHAAFTSEESLIDLRTRVCGQILQALQGEQPANVVNPEIYE